MDAGLLIEDLHEKQVLAKSRLIYQVVTKIVEEKSIAPALKQYLTDKDFLHSSFNDDTIAHLCADVVNRFEDGTTPTFEYLNQKYLFNRIDTTMSQYDLSSLLKDKYIEENFTKQLITGIKDLKSKRVDTKALKILLDKLQDTLVKVEDVKMTSFIDTENNKRIFNSIKDNVGLIRFKTMKPFNYLEFRLQELEGLMAGSGSGKSLVLEKLQADLDPDDYIVLHFSLEFPQKLYFKRLVSLLGWVAFTEFDRLSQAKIDELSRRLTTEYPNLYYACLDTDKSSSFNVHKIESLIKYYRNKYSSEPDKPMIVMVDYVQLLDDPFDPVSCRVNRDLHSLAVKYNCCIIETIQCNDEASKYEYPPELSMMGQVKALKNDCDIIQAFKGMEIESEPNKMIINSKTKKHRNGKHLAFGYEVDFNTSHWNCLTDLSRLRGI